MLTPQQCIVPNLLTRGLRIVFCGTAPGNESAKELAYYAHPQNKFWQTLVDVGLTPYKVLPREYARLLEVDIGLTDLCKHYQGNDDKLPSVNKTIFEKNIEKYQPAFVAFTSAKAGRSYCGQNARFGLQSKTINNSKLFILPSTSPRAQWAWDISYWHQLAKIVPIAE
jgi:TDG/mug DNA glycosylase family protein